MIDPYQFYEAKAIGADAVLLIAAILDDAQMKDFYQLSKELELDALVEVHDEKELERAMKIDADIIGVNNRNLKDFTISLDTTVQLSKLVPEDKVLVAESGILQDADVELLKECGVDAFLIGRALMEAVVEIAKKEGKHKLTLSSNHQLTSALRLYESMGFTYTTCDTPHFELSDIYMELLL